MTIELTNMPHALAICRCALRLIKLTSMKHGTSLLHGAVVQSCNASYNRWVNLYNAVACTVGSALEAPSASVIQLSILSILSAAANTASTSRSSLNVLRNSNANSRRTFRHSSYDIKPEVTALHKESLYSAEEMPL
ncbi:hypothetical protein ANAPC4_01400 [Anaplasma phagocytophilum]|nr:hypothetical protein ANAPC4_01400 [Anaplasma phagocytophilum]